MGIEHQIDIKDGLPVVGCDQGQEEDMFRIDQMGGRVEGETQLFPPLADFFSVGGCLIDREEDLRRQQGGPQALDGHGKKPFFPETLCRCLVAGATSFCSLRKALNLEACSSSEKTARTRWSSPAPWLPSIGP